jgi:DNA-binding LytR/AlgR family response regulator
LVRGDAILLARSVGNYTYLVTEAGEHSLRVPLGLVVEELRVFGLSRIHRSVAVNMARVRRVVGRGRHRLCVVLSTGVEIEVGRSYQRSVRAALGAATHRRSATSVNG